MWIEPTSFSPDLGRVLGLKLRVGDDFRGEPIPRNDELIERFVVVDANGQRDVVGRAGADPAGLLRVTATGPMVVGYQSRAHRVSLSGAKFTSYLKEQALDAHRRAARAEGPGRTPTCASSSSAARSRWCATGPSRRPTGRSGAGTDV